MTHVTPAVTTRPLYHLALEHGVDYTDVLNVAWGIKSLLNGAHEPNIWYGPSLTQLVAAGHVEAFEAVQRHVTNFVHEQDTLRRAARTQALRDAIADQGEFPDEPHIHEGP